MNRQGISQANQTAQAPASPQHAPQRQPITRGVRAAARGLSDRRGPQDPAVEVETTSDEATREQEPKGHDFTRVRVSLRPRAEPQSPISRSPDTIVEGLAEDDEEQRLPDEETEETSQSAEHAALVALPAKVAHAAPGAGGYSSPLRGGASARPVSLSALRAMSKGRGVQISGPPVGKSLADISAGGGAGAAGYTDWPSGYVAPDFEFNATKTGTDWSAKPTLKAAANEGTSGSFYTSAGKHKTGTQEGGKDVYWNFSAAISSLVQTGEQEHCDDFAEAYRISLKEAETVITTHLAGKTFGPKATRADAENLVLAEITSKLTHPGLGNDKTKWAGTYNTLFTKTLTRDTSGWHSISLGARSVDRAGNVVYKVVKGTSQIGTGTHAPSTIIKY